MNEIKAKVSKTTLDNAIKAYMDLMTAARYAAETSKKLKFKKHDCLYDLVHGYLTQLEEQTGQSLRSYFFSDIIYICTDISDTPYETAYKMLALLGIEVAV